MQVKFPFDTNKPIIGEASIDIDTSIDRVFYFVGECFFDNYPKWAEEVVDFTPLDSHKACLGAKGRQVRKDNGVKVESTFEITQYEAPNALVFQGISAPYRHAYLMKASIDNSTETTHLTFHFELLEIDVFMRPFEKLIRTAIEDGAETIVSNIKSLISADSGVTA